MRPRRNPATGPNMLEIRVGSVHPESVDIPVDVATLPGSQVMDGRNKNSTRQLHELNPTENRVCEN